MSKHERRSVQLDDDEGGRLHAIWSRSAKRLISTTQQWEQPRQVELSPDQVEALVRFLSGTVALAPEDR